MHDDIAGETVDARRNEIQHCIEDHLELDTEGLGKKDHCLLMVNMDDLKSRSGEEQHYWLLYYIFKQHDRSEGLEAQINNVAVVYHSREIGNKPFSQRNIIPAMQEPWTFNSQSLPRNNPGRRKPALPCGT